MKYDDFDLQIEPAGEKFRVRLLNAPTGQATTEFVLPFTEIEVGNFLSRIGQVRRTMRRLDAPELQAAKEFGGKLFGAIFSGEMIAQLRGSMEQASDKEHGLRIRLCLTDVPALADLPWEFLYDANQNHFLTTSSETPVVRFLDLPQRIAPLRVALPLRVLVMIASPRNLKRLDTEGEWGRLQESLADLLRGGQIRLERLPAATLDALRLRARGAPFHVFHFIGHGGFDEAAQDGVLQFEDETGMSYPVRGEMLGMQLHDHRSLRLAVLNACEGARSSRQDPFSGVAQSLLQQRVPAVIAMQFEISDAAAKVFASEFYRAVAEGNPVDAAVCESRKALFKEEFGQEWATPVLYMRSQEGQLFELQAVAAPPLPDEDLLKRELEEAQNQAAAKAEAERAAKVEKERLEREKAEKDRLAFAKAEADRQAVAKAEAVRVAAQRAEAARAAQAEKERRGREKAEQERLANEKAAAERRAVEIPRELAEEAMREGNLIREKLRAGIRAAEQARAEAADQAEKERLVLEKTARENQAREKAESERQAAARAEAERAANAGKERQAKEAADRARSLRQQEEAERRAKERAEYERLQREKTEADRRAR
ncbi:MAG TPA: CHAT domain-containing protein, partial [Candidatus Acidoferrum sp.]|nr:CHAT domain-containing protein [Candidatus Acidoferrum sp.]